MLLPTIILSLTLFTTVALAAPHNKRYQDASGPVIETDFPDPSIINVNGTWYAFGTQSEHDYQDIRVQLATSLDFETWSLAEGYDAMGTLGAWVTQGRPAVWAPDVYQREDGSFIIYYSAVAASSPRGLHCVGTAISDDPRGPYHSNSDEPFACPLDQGGAIDASAFKDPDDGARYVLYKIDGNALRNGGICGNTVEPLVSTPIVIQEVETDWTTPIGDAVQILDRGEYDGPLVEAPSMIEKEGTYFLFFSSNCYSSSLYDTGYATSRSPKGPFAKTHVPLLVTSTLPGTHGPGHADVSCDGVHIAFHAYATEADIGQRRAMFVRTLDVGGDLVSLH